MPNPLARSLVTKKSQLIGVIIPEVSDSFVSELVNGIEEVAKMYDYDILLANTYSDKEQELKSINLLRAKQVEGIVMMSWKVDEEHLEFIQNCRIPAVYVSKTARNYDVYSVSISNTNATYDMTKYLIDKGHKKISFIMTSEDDTVLEAERYLGFEKAMKDNNLEIDKSLVKNAGTTYDYGYEKMKEILDEGNVPEAVFVTGDEAAIGALNAICDAGYRVPEDISVAGFNDAKIAAMYRPKLTTVHQPLYDMGAVAIRMVIKMIDKEVLENKR
ncbi:periplasmic binding s and sugar binding domain of LacI family protein [[Clostridium] sordellii ATCC 9714]|nr:periplasmic binding s and sugar binding domain of LacI family protein [[Clostridium] sordellii ATCC 9714] [Paeniclostridium sordellii ATCC 9714]